MEENETEKYRVAGSAWYFKQGQSGISAVFAGML